jgi:uncharacterized protein YlxP (DUF503 family)
VIWSSFLRRGAARGGGGSLIAPSQRAGGPPAQVDVDVAGVVEAADSGHLQAVREFGPLRRRARLEADVGRDLVRAERVEMNAVRRPADPRVVGSGAEAGDDGRLAERPAHRLEVPLAQALDGRVRRARHGRAVRTVEFGEPEVLRDLIERRGGPDGAGSCHGCEYAAPGAPASIPVVGAGFVGILSVELHFPESHSLKEKRMHLRSAKAQLQNRVGASVAEVDHHDVWQRSRLTLSCVAREYREAERLLAEAERWLAGQAWELGRVEREVVSLDD